MDLYLLKFNNYYNRIVKKFDTLAEYLSAPYYNGDVVENLAFDPNDNVNTYQIVNTNYSCDYAVLADGNEIVSRWFVIETKRLRNRQWQLQLRRDLIVDNYTPIINAPCFIEKATVNNDDPAIFNKENISFNQIKTSETLLKDRSGCPWIVGYYAKDYVDKDNPEKSLVIDKNNPANVDVPIDIVLNGDISTWEYYQWVDNYKFATSLKLTSYAVSYYQAAAIPGISSAQGKYLNYEFGPNGITEWFMQTPNSWGNSSLNSYATTYEQSNEKAAQIANKIDFSSLANLNIANYTDYYVTHTQSQFDEIVNLNGKIISYVDNGVTKYKRIKVTVSTRGNIYSSIGVGTDAYNILSAGLNELIAQGVYSGSCNENTFKFDISPKESVRITLYDYAGLSGMVSVPKKSNRYDPNEQPFAMFAIPYGEITVKNSLSSTWVDFKCYPNMALAVAYKLIEKYSGSGTLYDVQLLPYCPMQNIIVEDGAIDIKDDNKLYELITATDTSGDKYGVIINCSNTSFSFNIQNQINIEDFKLSNECDLYRLVSPNFNGQFEFSAAKNGGVNFFNVDCDYRPYTPYIHINPDFKRLYGEDFNDPRGLICGGDFGLTQISDAWQNYQIQNKNYQEIFNRQIQNMETNNAVQKEREAWQTAAGVIGGGIGGAIAGGITGPIGAAVGGIVGAGASAIAGARDIELNNKLRNEAIDFSKDNFGYQLGNIKALPDNLTKVSSFNQNNKLFPILEYYTCTETEKQALINKIKYNGMTVMRIGTIAEFIKQEPTYIKGQLIRLETVQEDTNYINEIANEINKGVFI